MPDVSLEIENQSYTIEIETSTQDSSNEISVDYDSINSIEIISNSSAQSTINPSDIIGFDQAVARVVLEGVTIDGGSP